MPNVFCSAKNVGRFALSFHRRRRQRLGRGEKLTASDAGAWEFFGRSVAVAGDVAVVGADCESAGGLEAGAAYVFGTYVPPPSDMFADAESLPGDTGIASGSNTNATIEPDEPAHAGYGPFHSVWWNWSAPTSALLLKTAEGVVFLVDTHGSDFDTVLAIYTGTVISNLTIVATNDNSGTGIETSEVSFQFITGETYHIAVAGKTATDTGNVVLNYEIIPEPGFACYLLLVVCCNFRSSLTNSRFFWYNEFTIIPEGGFIFLIFNFVSLPSHKNIFLSNEKK